MTYFTDLPDCVVGHGYGSHWGSLRSQKPLLQVGTLTTCCPVIYVVHLWS